MLIDDVQQAMYAAMKAREAGEAAALRLVLSALKSAAIEARRDLTDEEAVTVMQREAKKRREAEQAYRDAGRDERAGQEAFELTVIARFLPAGLDPAELARQGDGPAHAAGEGPSRRQRGAPAGARAPLGQRLSRV